MKLLTIALTALTLCGAALAAPIDIVTVHFPAPVMVGEKTLPAETSPSTRSTEPAPCC